MRGFYKVALTGAIVGSALSMGTVQASASNVKVHLKTKIGSKVYKLGDISVKKIKQLSTRQKSLSMVTISQRVFQSKRIRLRRFIYHIQIHIRLSTIQR